MSDWLARALAALALLYAGAPGGGFVWGLLAGVAFAIVAIEIAERR